VPVSGRPGLVRYRSAGTSKYRSTEPRAVSFRPRSSSFQFPSESSDLAWSGSPETVPAWAHRTGMLVPSVERSAHIKPPPIPAGSWLPRPGVGFLVNELTFPLSDWRLRPWATKQSDNRSNRTS
jgi:hypothetical protein